MVGFINTRVSVQPLIDHEPVDKVIDNGGDVIYAARPIVEGGCVLGVYGFCLLMKPISF